MSLLKSNDKAMIVGVTGNGKTFLARWLRNNLEKSGVKVLVFDAEHEKQYNDLIPTKERPDIRYRPKIPVTYETAKKFKAQLIREFDQVCGYVFNKGDMILLVESIDLFCPSYLDLPPNFYKIIHWGKKRGIGFIGTSRRIADTSKSAVSQCKHWFIFYTFIPNDIDYLKKFVGKDAEKARDLKERYYLYWTQGKSQVCSPITGET